MIAALHKAPANAELDALLVAAGETVWRAGPLTKGPSLCHGTAGNGLSLLLLHQRTADAVWKERAQQFAMHALMQSRQGRETHGHCRASLHTGDGGVAFLLHLLLSGGAGWPLLDV